MNDTRRGKVEIYKDQGKGGNGTFTTVTTESDAGRFLETAAMGLLSAIHATPGDEELTVLGVLPQICELWAKLKGYRADVYEEKRLIVGQPNLNGLTHIGTHPEG